MSKSADSIDRREKIYRQLAPKFPAAAIGWVRTVPWSGPTEVPVDQINSTGRAEWSASHDPAGVKAHLQKLRDNTARPAVLVRGPSGKTDIVDGHHRYLAAESEGRPLLAWVARVPSDVGPWTETHSSQKGGTSA